MVPSNKVSAVLCSTDLERSQEFYEQKVGLTLSPATIPNHLVFECCDGTTVLVVRSSVPQPGRSHPGPVCSTDVAADVQELLASGVEFDVFEFRDLKTVNYVLTSPGIGKSAWFKDPDGNTLALYQPE